jgi:hypothetical protein
LAAIVVIVVAIDSDDSQRRYLMSDSSIDKRLACQSRCEDQFARCTKKMPSGCVEDLRLCRESCALPSKD